MTKIGKLIKDIQYATDLSIEQIANKIGYSRPHMMRLIKEGESKKVLDALNEKFSKALGKKQPPSPMEIEEEKRYSQIILNLTESNRKLSEAIADLSKKINSKK